MVESNKLLKVNPPIHRLGSAGRWVRAQLQAGILSGTPVLVRIQNLRSPWLNRTMHVISFLGEEDFYTPLVAFIVWVVDAQLGRLLALLMALAFYLTGTCKNLLCLPRPRPLPSRPSSAATTGVSPATTLCSASTCPGTSGSPPSTPTQPWARRLSPSFSLPLPSGRSW